MQHEALTARVERALEQPRHLQPRASVDSAWHAIEVSEQYGTLRERTTILLLVEAFFRANQQSELWHGEV